MTILRSKNGKSVKIKMERNGSYTVEGSEKIYKTEKGAIRLARKLLNSFKKTERMNKLHVAISIADHSQIKNRVFNRGRGIPYIVANLKKFEYEISCLSKRKDFTEEEADERYVSAMTDKAELVYDSRIYAQECKDYSF